MRPPVLSVCTAALLGLARVAFAHGDSHLKGDGPGAEMIGNGASAARFLFRTALRGAERIGEVFRDRFFHFRVLGAEPHDEKERHHGGDEIRVSHLPRTSTTFAGHDALRNAVQM